MWWAVCFSLTDGQRPCVSTVSNSDLTEKGSGNTEEGVKGYQQVISCPNVESGYPKELHVRLLINPSFSWE